LCPWKRPAGGCVDGSLRKKIRKSEKALRGIYERIHGLFMRKDGKERGEETSDIRIIMHTAIGVIDGRICLCPDRMLYSGWPGRASGTHSNLKDPGDRGCGSWLAAGRQATSRQLHRSSRIDKKMIND
jgi:hypothetical protein